MRLRTELPKRTTLAKATRSTPRLTGTVTPRCEYSQSLLNTLLSWQSPTQTASSKRNSQVSEWMENEVSRQNIRKCYIPEPTEGTMDGLEQLKRQLTNRIKALKKQNVLPLSSPVTVSVKARL